MMLLFIIRPLLVIASEAKQSIDRTMDCRAASRRLAMTGQMNLAGSI